MKEASKQLRKRAEKRAGRMCPFRQCPQVYFSTGYARLLACCCLPFKLIPFRERESEAKSIKNTKHRLSHLMSCPPFFANGPLAAHTKSRLSIKKS